MFTEVHNDQLHGGIFQPALSPYVHQQLLCVFSSHKRSLVVCIGVYTDMDTDCTKPLDDWVRADDTLIVGWENEFTSDEGISY